MYLNTFELVLWKYFSEKQKIIYLKKKLGEYNRDNAKMIINFYASLKTIIVLSISFVYKRKKKRVQNKQRIV